MYLVTWGSTPDVKLEQLVGLGSRDPSELVRALAKEAPRSTTAVVFGKSHEELACVIGHRGQVQERALIRRQTVAVRQGPAVLRPLFRDGVPLRPYELVATRAAGVPVPVLWKDVAALASAMDALSTMVAEETTVEVCTRACRVRVTVRPGELLLEPVAWTGVSEADAVLASTAPPFDWGVARRATFARPPRSKHRPLTTGDAKARLKAIPGRAGEANQTMLLEALIDPANAGPYYEGVRRRLYEAISWHDVPDVHAAFRHALRIESDEVADYLARLAWRLKPVLSQWARDDLVRAWSEDRRFALRILSALDEAYFELPPEWVAGAPPELRVVLARPAGHRATAADQLR